MADAFLFCFYIMKNVFQMVMVCLRKVDDTGVPVLDKAIEGHGDLPVEMSCSKVENLWLMDFFQLARKGGWVSQR